MQLMRASAERAQLLVCGSAISRLGEARATERECLIGADDKAARKTNGDDLCLFPRQQLRRLARTHWPRPLLDTALIDVGDSDLDRYSCCLKHCPPCGTARGQHQRIGRQPERHRQLATCRRLSASSAITAAAVSSIERRVTSISGQLFAAHSRRENAISSATA